jgi:hypothetical protein
MAGFPATGARAPARQRKTGRLPRWTLKIQDKFLEALQTCLNVRRSAAIVGLTARSAYQLKRRDADFARRWAEALDVGYSDLELRLLNHSIHGVERTETVHDAMGKVKHFKVTHSFPHGMSMRLLLAHRKEVQAYRAAQVRPAVDAAAMDAKVKAHMDMVRAQLRATYGERKADPSADLPDASP